MLLLEWLVLQPCSRSFLPVRPKTQKHGAQCCCSNGCWNSMLWNGQCHKQVLKRYHAPPPPRNSQFEQAGAFRMSSPR